MKQKLRGMHYGKELSFAIERGAVVIRIGVQTLANAVSYSDWANLYSEEADDYIRTFAIEDEHQFAKDVMHAMLAEREDGSTPLSDLIDKSAEDAVNDGSLGLHEDTQRIKHGEYAACERWAVEPAKS